jgi:CPA2 family monovalent cation:H+ antiporter-2
MYGLAFLQDLAVVMAVAGLVTLLFHRLKQPVVLGYLLAGFIIGPYTPPFPLIRDELTIRTLADLGVIVLMFSLGLEFSLRTLREVGRSAFIVAAVEITLMVLVGYEVALLLGLAAGRPPAARHHARADLHDHRGEEPARPRGAERAPMAG